ncbi:MAG: hypothetical protein FWD94_04810, partial [Treponema sp.]|nr:hypothetical protein [Treponema sp.]
MPYLNIANQNVSHHESIALFCGEQKRCRHELRPLLEDPPITNSRSFAPATNAGSFAPTVNLWQFPPTANMRSFAPQNSESNPALPDWICYTEAMIYCDNAATT